MPINIYTLIILSLFFISVSSSHSATILDFNESGATGTTFPGWTWYYQTDTDPTGKYGCNGEIEIGNGHHGWRLNTGRYVSGATNWQPRLMEKYDYTQDCYGSIGSDYRAPSTSTGAGLRVYDSGSGAVNQASWWYSWDTNFSTQGKSDGTTNRLDFYFKPDFTADSGLTSDPDNGNIHIGTYLCWPGGGLGGEDCPEEAANQHYYHYLTVNPGAWLHVQLDRHPTHQRGLSGADEPENDPSFIASGHHYYEYMNNMYLEIRYAQTNPTQYYIDEMKLWTEAEEQNEISVASVWVGYWSATGKWEIGFNDNSFNDAGYNSTSQSTFEVRWSTSPITNANYASASPIEPEYWERGTSNTFYRINSWKKPAWTRFDLPAGVETSNSKIYFAIKDVSLIANGDGHDAPSSLIKTIDYSLSASTTTLYVTPSKTSGRYTTPQSVTLTPNDSATIYYTLDGTTPTESSTQYLSAITVLQNVATTVLKYFAKDTAGNSSSVQAQTYRCQICN